jgi:hypothetical protein
MPDAFDTLTRFDAFSCSTLLRARAYARAYRKTCHNASTCHDYLPGGGRCHTLPHLELRRCGTQMQHDVFERGM